MNYACWTDRPFVTTKPIEKKRILSQQAKSIREFIYSHSVTVSVNQTTNEATASVMKRGKES